MQPQRSRTVLRCIFDITRHLFDMNIIHSSIQFIVFTRDTVHCFVRQKLRPNSNSDFYQDNMRVLNVSRMRRVLECINS